MDKKRQDIIIFFLVLVAAILLALNLNHYFFRIDLTSAGAFSVSKVSRTLFEKIPDRVYLTYYVSDKLRSLYAFPTQVEDLLNEYAAFSRGKIVVGVQDPVRTGEVSQAESLGVLPQQIEVVEKDQRSVAMVYTGVVIHYLDRHDTLPVVSRTETLEYELTSKIRKIVSNEEKVLGLLVGDPDRSYGQDYQRLLGTLSGDFKLQEVVRGQAVPEDLAALFVIGNQSLDEFDLYPIDQYLMKGGKALFAVRGVRIDFQRNLQAEKLGANPLLDMLESYGVRVKRELLLDRYCRNFRIPRQVFGQVMWEMRDKYPYWITIADSFVSKTNPITARFSGLDLYWPCPLEVLERPGVKAEVLIRSTPESWTESEGFQTLPDYGSALLMGEKKNKGQQPLAVALTGKLSSYFKGKPVPVRKGETRDWKETAVESPETRLIVVGETEFGTELYQYTDAAYNMEFLSNVAGWLSNSEDLLQIKTRVSRDLRLNKIQDPQLKVAMALVTQGICLILMPLLVIAFAVLRHILRGRRAV